MLFYYKSYVGLLLKVRSQVFVDSVLVDVAFSLNKTYYVLIIDLLFLIDISSVSHEMTVIEMSHVELISHLAVTCVEWAVVQG